MPALCLNILAECLEQQLNICNIAPDPQTIPSSPKKLLWGQWWNSSCNLFFVPLLAFHRQGGRRSEGKTLRAQHHCLELGAKEQRRTWEKEKHAQDSICSSNFLLPQLLLISWKQETAGGKHAQALKSKSCWMHSINSALKENVNLFKQVDDWTDMRMEVSHNTMSSSTYTWKDS